MKEDSSAQTLSKRVYLLNLNLGQGFISLIKRNQPIKAVYKRGMGWRRELNTWVLLENLKERDGLEDIMMGDDNMKLALKYISWEAMDWIRIFPGREKFTR